MKFPSSLEEFGYAFNNEGQLRHIQSGLPFNFDVQPGNRAYNQENYEAFGEVITEYIYSYLVEELGLEKIFLPLDASSNEPRGFVFATPDFHINRDKLLILIHGSGAVRAGQWARKLIVNDCLDSGTQIPYIRRAVAEGYSVLVLNTNQNKQTMSNGASAKIRGSESPERHGEYVFNRLVLENCPAVKMAIVAHSFGGVVTKRLSEVFETDFKNRVAAIALTDSVHSVAHGGLTAHFIKMARNWVTSAEPLDTEVRRRKDDVACVSAGTLDHGTTSSTSIDSVFDFLAEQLSKFSPHDNLKTYSLRSKPDKSSSEKSDEQIPDKEL